MKFLLVLSVVLVAASAGKVQVKKITERGHGKLGHDKVMQLVQDAMVEGKLHSKQDALGNAFGKTNDKKKQYVRSVHLQQEFLGFDVYGYGMSIQDVPEQKIAKRDGKTKKPTGKVVDIPATTIVNGLFVDNLEQIVKKGEYETMVRRQNKIYLQVQAKKQKEHGTSKKYEHGIGEPNGIKPIIYVNEETNEAMTAYLVYFVDKFSEDPSYPNFIVDKNGHVLEQWEGLNTNKIPSQASGPGGNIKIGRTEYESQIPVTDNGNGRCLMDTEEVRTIDLRHGYSTSSTTPFQFDCYTNTNREVNQGYSPMNDAQVYGTDVFRMFEELYNTAPLEQTPLLLKVHYRRGYDNAFFDGSSMTFGDGRTLFYPLTALDVVAHEVAHGVTRQSSNLVYRGESGGLNEAFSDMAGKAVERYVRGFENTNFGVGFDISKRDRPLRCMDNPPCDGRSIDHVRDYTSNLNVHYSSGIYNKVFHLLSTNPNFVNDLQDAFDLFYVANTQYWNSRTGFTQGAELMLQATEDVIGGMHLPNDYSHIDINVVVGAFRTVGVGCSKSGSSWDCNSLP